MKFELSDESTSTVEDLKVPFLVIKEPLVNPILGFYSIKALVNNTNNENALFNLHRSNVKKTMSNNIKALVSQQIMVNF